MSEVLYLPQDLEAPLISDQSRKQIEECFLYEPPAVQVVEDSKIDEEHKESEQNAQNQSKNDSKNQKFGEIREEITNKETQKSEEKPPIDIYDFSQENSDLFTLYFTDEKPKEKENDIFTFFRQASSKHPVPTTQIIGMCYLKSDPTYFSLVQRASKEFFNDPSLQLRELMCLADYKKLNAIRVKNYIFILRMITNIDKSQQMYKEVKTKLFQIKPLCQYLGLIKQKSKDDISQTYRFINKNKPIYDFEKEHKPSKQYEDYIIESDSENENNQQKQGQKDQISDEFSDYLLQSKLSNQTEEEKEIYQQALIKEEDKWLKRAEWLQSIVNSFQSSSDPKINSWVKWFQQKLESLKDFDIPFKNISPNNQNQDDSVFYLHSFLEKLINTRNNNQLIDRYSKHHQVSGFSKLFYPKVKLNNDQANNSDVPFIDSRHNVREKICLNIHSREAETDYFLTVFQRRPFGNEKVYEKRLNFNGKYIEVNKLEFNEDGSFIYFSFNTIRSFEKYDGAYNKQQFDFVFPIRAQYKTPLYIKPQTNYLGFDCNNSICSFKVVDKLKNLEDHEIINEIREQQQHYLQKDEIVKKETKIEESQQKNENLLIGIVSQGLKEQYIKKENEIKKINHSKKQFIRIYEHDLKDFTKISKFDFKIKSYDEIKEILENKWFGKTQQYFYMIYKKYLKNSKEFLYQIQVGTENFSLQFNQPTTFEKIDKQDEKQNENFCFNPKGDKLLMIYRQKGNSIQYSKFNIDIKKKVFVQENNDYKGFKEIFQSTGNSKFQFKIIPHKDDFIILAKNTSKGDNQIYIFFNDKFQIKHSSNFEDLSFQVKNGCLIKIYEINEQLSIDLIKRQNTFIYNEWNNQLKYQKWDICSFELINKMKVTLYPYIYFLYNHDQLYMKDLTKFSKLKQLSGYYYMNQFLGIDQQQRLITVFPQIYRNKLNLSFFITLSNYTAEDYYIRINQISTQPEHSHPFNITDTFLNYSVYDFNKDFNAKFKKWTDLIMDQNGNLSNEVRIISEENSLKIEKWNGFFRPRYSINRGIKGNMELQFQ